MRDKYNTALTPEEEEQFLSWANTYRNAAGGLAINDLPWYDVRGFWKHLQSLTPEERAAATAPGMHGPDIWKKPSHETFSDESMYHGVDGHFGGHWYGDRFVPYDPNLEDLWSFFK